MPVSAEKPYIYDEKGLEIRFQPADISCTSAVRHSQIVKFLKTKEEQMCSYGVLEAADDADQFICTGL